MQHASKDNELKKQRNEVQRITKQLIKNAFALPSILDEKEEMDALHDALDFFKKHFSCEVSILKDENGKHEKARNALPGKPAIVLE